MNHICSCCTSVIQIDAHSIYHQKSRRALTFIVAQLWGQNFPSLGYHSGLRMICFYPGSVTSAVTGEANVGAGDSTAELWVVYEMLCSYCCLCWGRFSVLLIHGLNAVLNAWSWDRDPQASVEMLQCSRRLWGQLPIQGHIEDVHRVHPEPRHKQQKEQSIPQAAHCPYCKAQQAPVL